MKTPLLIVLISIIIVSCKKETQNACKSDNPIENITWIKELKSSMTQCNCELSIIQGTYNHQAVFFIATTDPLCDGIDTPSLYDCNGNVVRSFNMNDYHDFYTLVTRDKVLYRCKKMQ
jgi:hypothetical protein